MLQDLYISFKPTVCIFVWSVSCRISYLLSHVAQLLNLVLYALDTNIEIGNLKDEVIEKDKEVEHSKAQLKRGTVQ